MLSDQTHKRSLECACRGHAGSIVTRTVACSRSHVIGIFKPHHNGDTAYRHSPVHCVGSFGAGRIFDRVLCIVFNLVCDDGTH